MIDILGELLRQLVFKPNIARYDAEVKESAITLLEGSVIIDQIPDAFTLLLVKYWAHYCSGFSGVEALELEDAFNKSLKVTSKRLRLKDKELFRFMKNKIEEFSQHPVEDIDKLDNLKQDSEYNVKLHEKISAGRFTIILDGVEKDGKVFRYSYLRFKPGVCVIPIVNGRIALSTEYRHTIKEDVLQFTCGMIDEGEEPEAAAKRELLGELGLSAIGLEYLGYDLPSIGSTDEKIYLFAAYCNGDKIEDAKREALEDINYELKTFEEIDELVKNNKLATGASVIAWYKLRQRR